ncbi:MAG: hypothetical protein MJ171_03295 [Clostridia bacterium]|nr:hypothetical protein [Clostridia bacterium]
MKELSPMIKPYFDAFDMYEVKSESLKKKVDEFKEKLLLFAEQNTDMMTFYSEFQNQGFMGEYTALISAVAMAAQESSTVEESSPVVLPTVKEFVEQYRTAYDEVRKAGDRPEGEKAYLRLFDVANRTDDLIEAQIIMEKERLLWNITSADAVNILENTLKKLDPLFRATSVATIASLDAYRKSSCEEELLYFLDKSEPKKMADVNDFTMRMLLAAGIAADILSFEKGRRDVYEWASDVTAEAGARQMESARADARRDIKVLKDDFNLTFDDLLADEGVAVFMLSPENMDEYGRTKKALHNRNYEVMREILYEEILSERTIKDILLNPREKAVWLKG